MGRKSERAAEARRQLLNRILASREFAHAHIVKRVLQYLVARHENGETAPKEYDIAITAMKRPETFDPRTDPIVRVSVANIRDRLLAYFATEGKQEKLRLTIRKGQYGVEFTEAAADEPPKSPSRAAKPLARFWSPYLAGGASTIIVYTEPLFFRDDEGHYVRDWYVNDLSSGPEQLRQRMPMVEGLGRLHPSFHYLSTGEVHCLLSLSRMFHDMRASVETRNSRISSWNELRNANLILLGSPRTNTFLRSLQGEEPLNIQADCVENRVSAPGEEKCYRGRRYLDGKLMRMVEFALVTRRPGLSPGSSVTMIAANHGRAIEGAGHFLTLEDRVDSVLKSLGTGTGKEAPPHFQLLIRVETIDVDDEVAQVQCIAARVVRQA